MKYVLAVSGGVDSVVLLWRTAKDAAWRKQHFAGGEFPNDFVVAHFNHGLRGAEAWRDADFVLRLAEKLGVRYYLGTANAADCQSEAAARTQRYIFLQNVCQQVGGVLVTAHHLNDLVETMAINLTRGTGWRGLAPLTKALRPLLQMPKADIVAYALEHNLKWREDSTNQSLVYLRNRWRSRLCNLPAPQLAAWQNLYQRQLELRSTIDATIDELIAKLVERKPSAYLLKRYVVVMLPGAITLELLRRLTFAQLTRPQLNELRCFICNAREHKVWQTSTVKVWIDQSLVHIECNKLSPVLR